MTGLLAAASEADRIGQEGVAEDLFALAMELQRIESSVVLTGYRSSGPSTGATLRVVPAA
jgi:hypothetical protein